MKEDYEVGDPLGNPTVAQMKSHREKKTGKSKARSCLFAAVSNPIFNRIMTLKTIKDIWDYLKKEYAKDERIRGMHALSLIREFEVSEDEGSQNS